MAKIKAFLGKVTAAESALVAIVVAAGLMILLAFKG